METIQTTGVEVEEPEADTEGEFRSLFTDADDGRARCESLAKAADTAGHPEIAKVYREIAGTVMTLIADMAGATGGALTSLEAEIDELEATGGGGDTPEVSGLLQEDADKYLQLFGQFIRLLDGLEPVVPQGPDGDPQRAVFTALRRMTEGMTEFTRSIVIDDPEEEEEETDDDDEAPDA